MDQQPPVNRSTPGKRRYSSPRVVDYGALTSLTLGSVDMDGDAVKGMMVTDDMMM